MIVATIVRGAMESSRNNFYYVTQVMKDTFNGIFLGDNPGEFGKAIRYGQTENYSQREFDTYAAGKPSRTWLKYITGTYTIRQIALYTNYKWKKVKAVNWVPSPNNIRLQKIIKPFIGKDDLRPVMSYVSVTQTGMFATDAYVLIHIPGKIPKSDIGFWLDGIKYGGGTLDDGTKIKSEERKFVGKFPNAIAVIPDDIRNSWIVDMEKIYNYCKLMKDSKFLDAEAPHITVQITPAPGVGMDAHNIGMDAKKLLDIAKSCLEMGGEWSIVLQEDSVTYKLSEAKAYALNKPILFVRNHNGSNTLSKRSDTYVLLMPVMLPTGVEISTNIINGERGERFTKSYFSISKNEIMQGNDIVNDEFAIPNSSFNAAMQQPIAKVDPKAEMEKAQKELKKAAPAKKKKPKYAMGDSLRVNWGEEYDNVGKVIEMSQDSKGDWEYWIEGAGKAQAESKLDLVKKKAAPGPKKKAALAEVAKSTPRRARVFRDYKNNDIVEEDSIFTAMDKEFKSLGAAKRYIDKMLKQPGKKPKVKQMSEEDGMVANYRKQSKKKILQRALDFHENRKPSAKKRDENTTSSKVLSPTPENLVRWKRNKGKFDMQGVDAKPGAKANADLKQSIDTWWKRFLG